MNEEILVVKNLRKTFTLSKKQQKLERSNVKRKVAVDDLSFTARRGEIFGLLGPNGAGKTTTLRMISTLIHPDSGDIFVDGDSVSVVPGQGGGEGVVLGGGRTLEDFFTHNYIDCN